MAGRGRGRGRSVSFDVAALGFGRGEALPGPISQPPPLFPVAEFKPVPLQQSEEFEYMLALKQEFLGNIRKSPYYVRTSNKKKDIERYSDKYQSHAENNDKWTPDWSRLPAELKPRKIRKTKSNLKPKIKAQKKKTKGLEDISKTLEALEQKEVAQKDEGEEEDEEGKEKENAEVEDDADELYDEEDIEEETDYILSYFDNGEDYGNDDDDADEGPVY